MNVGGDPVRTVRRTASIWKIRDERPNVEGASTISRNGPPSRKGCVVNGEMTKGRS